jgi:hypothetical protein
MLVLGVRQRHEPYLSKLLSSIRKIKFNLKWDLEMINSDIFH